MKSYSDFIRKTDPIDSYIYERITYNEFRLNYEEYLKEGFSIENVFNKIISSIKKLKGFFKKQISNLGTKIINIVKSLLIFTKRFLGKFKSTYTIIVMVVLLLISSTSFSNTINSGDGDLDKNKIEVSSTVINASIGMMNGFLDDPTDSYSNSDLMQVMGILIYMRDKVEKGEEISWDDEKIDEVNDHIKGMVTSSINVMKKTTKESIKTDDTNTIEYLIKLIEISEKLILIEFDVEGPIKGVQFSDKDRTDIRGWHRSSINATLPANRR